MKFRNFFKKWVGSAEPADTPSETSPAEPHLSGPSSQPSAPVIPVERSRPVPKTEPKPSHPLALKGGAKTQTDWLLLQIGKTGRGFIQEAQKNNLTLIPPSANDENFVRHDMTAALIGYRLVLTAYHTHQDQISLEALRSVRTAMIGMLHRAVDITIEKLGKKEMRGQLLRSAESQFKAAESEVVVACTRVKEKSQSPFKDSYGSIAPAFGSVSDTSQLHSQLDTILNDLYVRIEAAMATRQHQITG